MKAPTATSAVTGPIADRSNARSVQRARCDPLTGRGAGLEAQPPRRAGALARGAQPAQPLDEHRVELQRRRPVDQRVEHLVVAGGRHVEKVADGLLLGSGVLPPLPLEREDLLVALRQPPAGRGVRSLGDVHVPSFVRAE
jgi:hypothetical protein